MPSEVYSILVKAGFKGTEQEMYRTFALNGISPSIIANWTAGYNLIKAASNAGDVLTSNGAGTDPTWQAPTSGGPGGNDTEIQYNDSGNSEGDNTFTFDKTTKVVDVSKLRIAAGTTALPPIQMTSGDLLSADIPGALEFNTDDLYLGLSTGAGATYVSQYPPAQNSTYVKATTTYNSPSEYQPYFATDPAKSLTGSMVGNTWISNFINTNQRFHIDLGSGKVINRIYYENHHHNGIVGDAIYHFTFWGSNDANAFNELNYGIDTNWTQLTTAQNTFDAHIGVNQPDPKYILVNNVNAYRYYAFKFEDNRGTNYMAVRRIELQSGDVSYPRCPIVLADEDKLTATKIPLASTNGRLIDSGITQATGLTTIDRNTKVSGSVQVANNSDAAGASNVGAIRYRTSGNNSYCEMCMQTGASTYAWIVINTQSW